MDVVLRLGHTEIEHPVCCGLSLKKAHFKAPTVRWKDYDLPGGGFKAAHDGTVITSRKQNRDYMERNHLGDANQEYEVPTHEVQNREIIESQVAIDAITPTDAQMTQMKDDGTLEAIESMMND